MSLSTLFCRSFLRPIAISLIAAVPACAQWAVIDVSAAPQWVKELILIGKEIAIAQQMAADTMIINRNIQYQISRFHSKSWWRTVLPPVVRIQFHDAGGEVVGWDIATGGGYTRAGQVWQNSAVNLTSNQYAAAVAPGSTVRRETLATSEILTGLGVNGLAALQSNQQWLKTNLPAIQSLQATVLDGSLATNSLTQQMQEVALSNAQNTALSVQTLQNQNSQTALLTGIVKLLADGVTSDTQTQADAEITRQNQPTGVGGVEASFLTHP